MDRILAPHGQVCTRAQTRLGAQGGGLGGRRVAGVVACHVRASADGAGARGGAKAADEGQTGGGPRRFVEYVVFWQLVTRCTRVMIEGAGWLSEILPLTSRGRIVGEGL